jgi:hypothetical protein
MTQVALAGAGKDTVMRMAKRVLAGVVALGVLGFGLAAAQQGMHGSGGMRMHGHGMGHGMHDEASMPMLNGADTEPHEVEEMRQMFLRHPDIRRSVTNLPDGIATVTESADPELAGLIASHVTGMIGRLEDGRDPQVPIQSETLAILFANRALIRTEIEPTETGVRVIQRSDDPATVAALQTHAAEVSDMAARGMQAVHEAMMKR